MRKFVLLFLFSITLLSCSKKEKTYEELEAEVLCDVLPQIASEFVMTKLPPPPPPPNLNLSQKELDEKFGENKYLTDIIEYREKQKDSIKAIAFQKNSIKVSIINDLFPLYKNEIKFHKYIFDFDSIEKRAINVKELENSTIKFELKHIDSISKWMYFKESSALIRVSRVYINKDKTIAYFELVYNISLYPINVLCEKKNNKWIVKEIIKE